jgi:sugar lactone lactonase YvrE
VPGSTFLNDLAVADGVLYVSDSGFKPDFSSSGTEAVYRFENGKAVALARDTSLGGPNGLVGTPEGLVMVPAHGTTVWRFTAAGGRTPAATVPMGGMDGVVRTSDGSLLISSWDGKAVFKVDAQGQAQAVVQNVESPADIGYDSRRNRVLIPLFTQNRVEIRGLR